MESEFFTIPMPELHSPEWHEVRRLTWNASLAACLFNEHPYVTLADACVAKLSGHIEPETSAMVRGTKMEPYVADWLSDLLSVELLVPDVMFGRGHLVANPDRQVRDRPDLLVEIKTTEQYLREAPLRYWWYQAHAQLACDPDAQTVIIAALDASLQLRMFEVERDEEMIEKILKRAASVTLCIKFGEMPPNLTLSAENVRTLWPRHLDTKVEMATKDAIPLDHVREYLVAGAMEAEGKARKKAARDALVTALGPNAVGQVGGVDLVTYKASRDSDRFDVRSFADEHPDLYAAYIRKSPGGRRFHIIKKGREKLLPELEEVREEADDD